LPGTLLVFDSSTVLCWVLQEQRWQTIQRFLDNPKLDIVLPAPGLTEVIFKARAKGNVTAPGELAAAISSNRIQIMANEAPDYVRAAELLEMSQANPGATPPGRSRPTTLSLGDSLILAWADRMGCAVLSRDKYWGYLKSEGLLSLNIQTF
jgi:PIN domain nuclease of toxin-antitoxin system